MSGSTHESYDREEKIEGSSDRSFGLVFAGFAAIVSGLQFWHGGAWAGTWLSAALVLAVIALAVPRVLAPFNRVWLFIGLALSRVMQPLVMGLLFFLTVTPIGLLMRLLGKDMLRLRRDPSAATYWIPREPPGPAPDTMKNQF